MIKPAFCFLDESGTLKTNHPEINYFAVGAILHPWPDELIDKLHDIFVELSNILKKEPTRLEFKFKEVTKKSLPLYKKCLYLLSQDKDWRFFSVVIDLEDKKFNAPKDYLEAWECYLRWIKHLLQKNLRANEKTTLIADYLKKPKAQVHSIATLPAVVPQLWDVLQVESQGVLLVQMADVLLGGSLYNGIDIVKKELAQEVNKLKLKVGTARFNVWKVHWK